MQILTTLRQTGLVISRRGKNGGYLLARPPGEITLADIAMAMEGGYMDWSVIYMRDIYGSVPFTAAPPATRRAILAASPCWAAACRPL